MKRYKTVITEKAINDIYDITSYISRELSDPLAAERLLEKFESAIESLSLMPTRNALVKEDEIARKGIRRILVENYIVFYIADEGDSIVSIIRVLYNKREWSSLI